MHHRTADLSARTDLQLKETAINDPSFPALHIRPERGWLNDPNGVCLIDGRYHVFFQYNPDEPVHRDVKWGHASSTDLIDWRDDPVALINRPGSIDAVGCWSGCIVDDHGTPTAVYSAVAGAASDAQVALARSDRNLIDWRQSDHGVVGPPRLPGVSEARDPYVFSTGGHRYAVQGAGSPDGQPRLLHYRCDDLEQWEDLGVLLDDRDPITREVAPSNIWECPSLFPIGDRWVLILSLLQTDRSPVTSYLVGDLVPDGPGLRFVPSSGGDLDIGPAFYAPQVLSTADRTLMWGWARDVDRSPDEIAESGWSGALTFPRELSLRGETLISQPAAELIKFRGLSIPAEAPVTAAAFEIRAPDGVRLSLGQAGHERLVLDRAGSVQVFVDGSLIEVFSPGEPPATLRAYPQPGTHWSIEAPGEPQVTELRLPDR